MESFTKYGDRNILPVYSSAELLGKTVIEYLNAFAMKSLYLRKLLLNESLVKELEQSVEAIQSRCDAGEITFSDIDTPLLKFLNPNNPGVKAHEIKQIMNTVGIALTSDYEKISSFVCNANSKLRKVSDAHERIPILLMFLTDIKYSTIMTDYSSIYEYIGKELNYIIPGKRKVYPVTNLIEEFYDARNARILYNRKYSPARFGIVASNIALFDNYTLLNTDEPKAYEMELIYSVEGSFYHGTYCFRAKLDISDFRKYVINEVKGEYSLYHGRFHVFDDIWGESENPVVNTFLDDKAAIDVELAGGSSFKFVFTQLGEIYATLKSITESSTFVLRKANRENCRKIYTSSQRKTVLKEDPIHYSPIFDDDIFMINVESDTAICLDLLTPEYIQLYDGTIFTYKQIVDNLNLL